MNRAIRVSLAVIMLHAAACGGSSTDSAVDPGTVTPVGSTQWVGTLVGPSTSGALELVFSSPVSAAPPAAATADLLVPGSVTVTGTLKIGSVIVTLGGTYDPASHAFSVSGTGGGGTFVLTGTVTAAGIVGTFTGPGSTTGTFGALAGTSTTVYVYCGSYTNGSGGGTWNLVQAGSTLTGIAYDSASVALSGTVSGSTMNLGFSYTSSGYTLTGTATGTISGSTVNGTWTATYGGQVVDGGTFTGSRSSC
jgi:hypothetical protein